MATMASNREIERWWQPCCRTVRPLETKCAIKQ